VIAMNGGILIATIALCIPILSIIAHHLRRWTALDLEAARREVDIRRRFRAFDLIESRVADIEAHVTSREYRLNRELGELARKT
jgi:hypothetical protein